MYKLKSVAKWFIAGGLALAVTLTGYQPTEAKVGHRFTVKLDRCVDGDTARFSKVGSTRFLFVDTPESTIKKQPYGKEASLYTCGVLKKAKKIQLAYDGARKDKYGRTLAWVFVNGKLLQSDLTRRGYVKGFYDYGTYSYESKLRSDLKYAKSHKKGLYSGKKSKLDGYLPKAKPPISGKKGERFKNCTEMRKKYPHGVKKGHPAYESKHDRDKDGYACER